MTSKKTTITDIAKACNVSVATVSRAFAKDSVISQATKDKIIKKSKELGFKPKQYIKKKRKISKNNIVAVLCNVTNQPFAANLYKGISDVLSSEGIESFLVDTKDDPIIEQNKIEYFKDMVDGFITVPSGKVEGASSKWIVEISKKIPLVTCIRSFHIEQLDNVSSTNYTVSCELLQMLIDNGHKNIACISGPIRFTPMMNKIQAYNETLEANNLRINGEYMLYCKLDEETVADATEKLLRKHPEITALYGLNNVITRGILIALNRMNYSIPQNIALVAHGNDPSFSISPLLTLAVEAHEIEGREAAKLMIDFIYDVKHGKKHVPKNITIPSEIVIRGSEAYPNIPVAIFNKKTNFLSFN